MNKTLTYLFLAGLCIAGTTGCIKEDFSDCPPPVDPIPPVEETDGLLKLQLSYTMHNQKENGVYIDRFYQEVHKADVFVFDQNGTFVTRATDHGIVPADSTYTRTMKLPAGTYHASYGETITRMKQPATPVKTSRSNRQASHSMRLKTGK